MRAAVPAYLGSSFETAPPGHRFRLYFAGWSDNWELVKDRKKEAASSAISLPPSSIVELRAVRDRQRRLAGDDPALSVVEGVTTAPFTTGLGIEHPLENGFAFLDPHGLPYLPGSSVKGVVRRAAEELALFEAESHGWSIPALWWLFGFDASSGYFVRDNPKDPKPILDERGRWREAYRRNVEALANHPRDTELLATFVKLAVPKGGRSSTPTETASGWVGGRAPEIHTRGALELWDVIPEPTNGKLRVDIMNPHYGDYYQGKQPPGDWGSPIPIFFLTLPAGSTFTFIARFRPPKDWPAPVREHFEAQVDGKPRWQALVGAAFAFAFDWLGFGAKTAVGYGRMQDPTLHNPPFPRLQAPRPPRGRKA